MKRGIRRGPGRRTDDLPKDLLLVLTWLWDEQVRLTHIREVIWATWQVDLTESRISYICTHHLRRSCRYETNAHVPTLRGDRRRQDRGPVHERRTGRDRREPVTGVQVVCEHCLAHFSVFNFDEPAPCTECGIVRLPPHLDRKIS